MHDSMDKTACWSGMRTRVWIPSAHIILNVRKKKRNPCGPTVLKGRQAERSQELESSQARQNGELKVHWETQSQEYKVESDRTGDGTSFSGFLECVCVCAWVWVSVRTHTHTYTITHDSVCSPQYKTTNSCLEMRENQQGSCEKWRRRDTVQRNRRKPSILCFGSVRQNRDYGDCGMLVRVPIVMINTTTKSNMGKRALISV